MKPLYTTALLFSAVLARAAEGVESPPFERATQNAEQARLALDASHRYMLAWLRHADPESGLLPRNLYDNQDLWNGRDCAADNYPFMVLTAALTDRPLFQGRMHDMLATETRLTNRLDSLVDAYSFTKHGWYYEEFDLNRVIFDSSEYCKDGLMPLTEWLGRSPWSDRMIGIIDSIWQHAPVKTEFGSIPSDDVEVNGEMMQVTSRIYWMTGNDHYLDLACRIADYYLLGDHHRSQHFQKLQLRDHGCELISGLTEVYVACHYARPAKAKAYREPLYALLNRILEVGVNEHGMMYNKVNPQTGEIIDQGLSDSWGYNYNGYYTIYLVDGVEDFRLATRKALQSLKTHYWNYPWEGESADGIADSVEGAINLYNREPLGEVAEWIDANMERMLKIQKPDGIVEGWYGDGNFARTAIMYALWKQQGMTVQPWRDDVQLGAVQRDGKIYLVFSTSGPWQGRLCFDTPRHKTVMHLPLDYPRINQFPEWFTVDKVAKYIVEMDNDPARTLTGAELLKGLPLETPGVQRKRLVITPVAGD